ncbi:class E sortase [Nocardioides yefusunii]|uniref:Class E sortase n=1 Tax=Nocardioides yefusunii TaxID=2500546 RepID=A0ABW1QSB6_9ACTN|nr:class E sortase [Nocardioides yefusunii]
MSTTFRNLITNTVRLAAELALTAGFVLLLFAFYLLVWTGHRNAAVQADLLAEIRTTDSNGKIQLPAKPSNGDGVAIMHIPRFGDDWEQVIVEGTENEDLMKGPGHFKGTAMPGKKGNFAIAGHRATHGEPFAKVEEIEVGDEILVETNDEWLVYTVAWTQIVPPTAMSLLEPVPGYPGKKAKQRQMTIITCHPRWGSTERYVVGTQLTKRVAAEAGRPELKQPA